MKTVKKQVMEKEPDSSFSHPACQIVLEKEAEASTSQEGFWWTRFLPTTTKTISAGQPICSR